MEQVVVVWPAILGTLGSLVMSICVQCMNTAIWLLHIIGYEYSNDTFQRNLLIFYLGKFPLS